MTILGTDLLGTRFTTVLFDGIYEVEPSSGTSTELLVFVPIDVTTFDGAHTVEVLSYDEAGTRVHGPATFTVEIQPGDPGPPLLNLPESVVVEADSARGAEVRYVALAVSASTGDPVPVSCSPASETIFPIGTTIVQCTATDAGGTSTSGFNVFVTDTTPPELTVPADIETANPVVTFTATAVDNIDGPVPVTCSPASGSTFPSGRTKVICTATDAHQNLALGAFFVHTTGGPPRLTVPGNMFFEATSAAGAVVDFADEVIAEEATSVSCTPPSGSTFALGNTTVTCTAANAAGSTSASFVITVADNSGPVLNIPTILEVEATSPAGADVTYTVTATDAVDGPRTVDCAPASGTFFAFGTTTVFCTTVDTRGNSSDGSFDVVVQDTTGPTITVATANPSLLWPPNHRMVPVALTVQATDAVDPTPSIHIVSVSSNQPVNGTGDGDTGPDWVITSPLTVELRAERSGNSERIYTITVAATDLYGNVSTADVTVRVAQSKKGAALR
ncbi:MAG TPA: HYR domain-containing protein [Thermoanaerobaculia bacterium]